jgi:hypothetical protein
MANQVEDIKFNHKSSNGFPTECTNTSWHDQQSSVLPTLQKWV